MPLIEGKFDQVFPLTMNLLGETLMLYVKNGNQFQWRWDLFETKTKKDFKQ